MPNKTQLSFSKTNLLKGYQTLNKLWNRGFLPEDLELHYFLYWLAFCGSNMTHTAQELQMDRTYLLIHFRRFGFARKTYDLRYAWQRLAGKNKKVCNL
jgi:hypothetical protein